MMVAGTTAWIGIAVGGIGTMIPVIGSVGQRVFRTGPAMIRWFSSTCPLTLSPTGMEVFPGRKVRRARLAPKGRRVR